MAGVISDLAKSVISFNPLSKKKKGTSLKKGGRIVPTRSVNLQKELDLDMAALNKINKRR